MTKSILLVEDEARLSEQLIEILERNGYHVDLAEDGAQALRQGESGSYHAAIIDLGLPRVPGIEVIRSLRDSGRDYPVLVLTAKGDWQDKVDVLAAGADDYLVKPFHVRELLARIEALIRRASGSVVRNLQAGPIKLDTGAKTVTVNNKPVTLTKFEFDLLEYLMMRAGRVVSKLELTEHLYHQDFDRDSNVIEVFVGRLRKKLDPDGKLKPIETARGQGYRFRLDE